jgi:hypothetical protein
MNPPLAVSLIICYLSLSIGYSVIEKILQWQNSLDYYKEHFKRSFLKNHVRGAIIFVILLEIVCVGLNINGLYQLLNGGNTMFAIWGLLAVSITLIVLMTGQRIAQDFSGAMNITVYFILTGFGLFILERF